MPNLEKQARKSISSKLSLCAAALFLLLSANSGATFAQTDADNKAELVGKVSKYSTAVDGKAYDKFVTPNLSAQCWQKHLSDDASPSGVGHASRWGSAIVNYAKEMGHGDVNAGRPDQILAKLDGNFSYTIQAEKLVCDELGWRLLTAYSNQIQEFVGDRYSDYGMATGWRPKSGKMLITLVMSATAKDVTVTTDGATFTVTAPSDAEPADWESKIGKGLAKGGAK